MAYFILLRFSTECTIVYPWPCWSIGTHKPCTRSTNDWFFRHSTLNLKGLGGFHPLPLNSNPIRLWPDSPPLSTHYQIRSMDPIRSPATRKWFRHFAIWSSSVRMFLHVGVIFVGFICTNPFRTNAFWKYFVKGSMVFFDPHTSSAPKDKFISPPIINCFEFMIDLFNREF